MPLNCYTSLTALKNDLGISVTTSDSQILEYIEYASREIEDYCHRHFYTEVATRYFDGRGRNDICWLDDFLSITTAKQDDDDNQEYDEVLTENTDFWLYPHNGWPKTGIEQIEWADTEIRSRRRVLEIVGMFGYGDGESSDPWEGSAVDLDAEVSTTTATSITISVSAGIEAGRTIRIDSEQMFVSSVSGTTATVTRGVNGTTAATHSNGTNIETARYPKPIEQATRIVARWSWQSRGRDDVQMERVGEHTKQYLGEKSKRTGIERLLSAYRRFH